MIIYMKILGVILETKGNRNCLVYLKHREILHQNICSKQLEIASVVVPAAGCAISDKAMASDVIQLDCRTLNLVVHLIKPRPSFHSGAIFPVYKSSMVKNVYFRNISRMNALSLGSVER
jgi:hypothetical protein